MARPKTIKSGQKLNLYVAKAAKQVLFKMASSQGKSMSAVFSDLVMKAEAESQKPQTQAA